MKRENSILSPHRHPVLVGAAVIVAYGVARGLVAVREYLAIAFLAVVFATVLNLPIGFISRRLPRGVAVAITLLVFAALVVGTSMLVIPALVQQASQLIHGLPAALQRTESRLPSGGIVEEMKVAAADRVGSLFGKALPLAVDVTHALTMAVLIVVAGFFLAASPDSYFAGICRLLPREVESTFAEWWRRTGAVLRRWIGGTLVSMITMGTLTGIGLVLLGVHDWLLLALVTFVGTSVPYLGAIASSIPALIVAWTMSPMTAVWVLLLYIGVHHVEGYIVQPFIMKHAVALRPATLLGWLLLMTGIFGVAGALVATPALACVQVGVEYLYVERRLGK